MKLSPKQFFLYNLLFFALTMIGFILVIITSGMDPSIFEISIVVFVVLVIAMFVMFVWSVFRFFRGLFHKEMNATPHFFIMILSFLSFIVFPILVLIVSIAGAILILPLLAQ